MTEWNTPMGRFNMARRGTSAQGEVLTVPDEGQARQPLDSSEAKRFSEEAFSEKPHPQDAPAAEPSHVNRRYDPDMPPQAQEPMSMPPRRGDRPRDRISADARRRIQLLSGLGKICDDYDLLGTKYTFRSLSTHESKEVFASLWEGPTDKFSVAYKVRMATLARAITHIDENPVHLVLGSDDIDVRMYLFEELGEAVTDDMWTWYQDKITSVAKGKLSKEEVKEVTEDIKK